MKILFLNSAKKECGVYQYGLRLSTYLPMCVYREISYENEYIQAINEILPEKIIYNYHAVTMPWLNSETIYKNAKNVGITHESPTTIFDEYLDIDPSKPNGIPRPLFSTIPSILENEEHLFFINYVREGVPIFGSFGFGFENKGFDKIIYYVNQQFEKAIIKFIIPSGYYTNPQEMENTVAKCFAVERKPDIELMVSTDFFTNDEMLFFLKSNTMNMFLYDKMEGRGISSVLDYALSVDTPIGISDSVMFRHIYDDSICVYKRPISEIMKNYVNRENIIDEQLIVERVIGSDSSNAFRNAFRNDFRNASKDIIQIPVSIGEIVDKYSILEIKIKNINDHKKLNEIKRELKSLEICKKFINQYNHFYKQLLYINQKIWDFTNEIKILDIKNENYAKIASDIFSFNQKRFRLKKYFNDLNNSSLKEQKSYAETSCTLIAKNLLSHMETIGFLCIEHDAVYIDDKNVKDIMKNPNLYLQRNNNNENIINLDNSVFEIPKPFRIYPPIYYESSGLLGDFIQQLSIVCENFHKTGRKGIVYMNENLWGFRRGIESTYNDIYSIVKSQYYIEDLHIVDLHMGFGEPIINLSIWRKNPYLYNMNWRELFLKEYDIEFGKHKWIDCEVLPQWKSKVVIHSTQYRFPPYLNYNAIIEQYDIENVVYLNMEENDFEYFSQKTGINLLPLYKPASFEELCKIIHSCKLFVGALSMPLTIAHATHVDRIVSLSGSIDDKLNIGLNIPNIVYEA